MTRRPSEVPWSVTGGPDPVLAVGEDAEVICCLPWSGYGCPVSAEEAGYAVTITH